MFLLAFIATFVGADGLRVRYSKPYRLNSDIRSALSAASRDSSHQRTTVESKHKDFGYLTKFLSEIDALSRYETEYISSFWSNELQSFKLFPHLNVSRIAITTTCITLNAITANPAPWSDIACWEWNNDLGRSFDSNKISIGNVVRSLFDANWTMDPFQTPTIIHTLCSLGAFAGYDDKKYANAVDALLEQRSRVALHRKQKTSAYLRYQNVKALLAIVESQAVPNHLVGTNQIGYALERANLVSFDELCRQLAFYNAGDSANFDIIVLIYAFLAYYSTSQSIFLSSFARGVLPATNVKLCKAALETIFKSQKEDGTWPIGEPIFSNGESKSRDIGNNYIFFFNFIADMLNSVALSQPNLFSPYLENLERCLNWANTNVLEEVLPDFCDSLTNRCYGRTVKGWRSNHMGAGGAIGWCTSEVFLGITGIKLLLQSLLTTSILEEFNGRLNVNPAQPKDFNNLMDADLELCGERTTLKSTLFPRVIEPLLSKQNKLRSALINSKPTGTSTSHVTILPPTYSMILFGPPGTAKTTICTSIATSLGWNFVTIDTASFLANGLENIASRMVYIFDRLKTLEKTIILFDEIEEFCLDRDEPSLAMESRLLTTAMLTQLNELRRRQTSLFILATNKLNRFDAAVIRPGRFDMLLFVGTPNLPSRLLRLKSKLASLTINDTNRERSYDMISDYMTSNWSDELRFFTFAENELFLNSMITSILASSDEVGLHMNSVVSIKNNILRTSTIQGNVKQEYIESEKMSRL